MKHKLNLSTIILLLTLLAGCTAPAVPTVAEKGTQHNGADLAGFPVTITHDRGEITLEQPAERIIVFSEEFTELFVALDLAPVGVALWRNEPTGEIFNQLPYLDQPIPGEPRYINGSEPNLEVIAALQPDLILNHEYNDSGTADLQASLAQIAPVLTYYGGEVGGWKRAIRGLGQATGYSERAEAVIADYDTRVAGFQAEMAPIGEQAPEVALLLSGVDFVGIFDERFAIGGLMQVLGFTLSIPESIDVPASGYVTISVENLHDITADTVMQMRFSADQEHISDPILASLSMPTLQTEIYQGMGYTGPFAETIYLEGFAEAFRTHYATTASGATTADCEAGFRPITSNFGPTCIPAAPARIIAMNEGVMANLLALNITPIGVVDYANRDYTQYLGDTNATIASVGTTDGSNFEAMLALKPDLILAMENDVDEKMLELLTQIAPVAVSTVTSSDWRGNIRFTGDAVGKAAATEALVETTEARLAEFRTAYTAQAGDETIAIIRSRADSFNIYNKESFIAELSKEAGLQMPGAIEELEPWNTMSLEALPLLTSDKLFVMVRNEREAGMFVDMNGNSLWQTLPAVQNDEVHLVNWSVWVAGWNIIGANLVIDDFFFYLLGTEAPTPNPFNDLIIDDFGPQHDEMRLSIQ